MIYVITDEGLIMTHNIHLFGALRINCKYKPTKIKKLGQIWFLKAKMKFFSVPKRKSCELFRNFVYQMHL